MNIVWILRELWRLRVFVVVVVIFALLAAVAVSYRVSFPGKLESRRYHVGVATARLLVDTPSSQVVEVSPKGSDTLGVRANLIASLMVDGVFKSAIARRAGLPPDQLVGISQNGAGESQPAGAPPKRGVNVLNTRVIPDLDGNQLPIIQIDTQASDAAGAARLADAAVAGLRDYLDSQASAEQVPAARRLRVGGLGAAQASEVTRGPSVVLASGIAIFVFVSGCALILGVVALIRGWRASALADEWPLETLEDDDTEAPDSDDVATVVRPAVAARSSLTRVR
jgi:hypothetical protein